MDYVDIVFASRYDHETPLEEVCRAMDHLVRTERTLYWGTSEWSAEQITAANELCKRLNLYPPIVEQTRYNMMHRQKVEAEYAEVLENYKTGLTVWSPLAAGLLTGKYLDDPNAGRLKTQAIKDYYSYNDWFGPENIEKTRARFKGLEEIAKELDGTLSQVALAWVLRSNDVSTIICGFTKVEQVEENLGAIELLKKFTPEIDERIEKLLDNKPKMPMDFRKHGPRPSRR